MTESSQENSLAVTASKPDSTLIIVRAAIFAGCCRLLPIPFVDDWLVSQVRRHLLGSLLKIHQTSKRSSEYSPIYGGTGGCFGGTLWFILIFPFKFVFKLLLKLFRTIVIVLLIRDVAIQILRTMLLGSTIERCILDGRLSTDPDTIRDVAKYPDAQKPGWVNGARFEKAFHRAFRGSDWKVIVKLFARTIRELKSAGAFAAYFITFFRRSGAGNQTVEQDYDALPEKQKSILESITHQILELFGQPEVIAYRREFDDAFDREWEKLAEEKI